MLCMFVSMADVIAWQMLYALLGMWQMLLPRGRWLSSFYLNGRCYCHCNVADVFITTVYCNYCIGWCYCQVADGIATCYCLFLLFYGQMLLTCGRWNGHYFVLVCDGRCYCPVTDGMTTAGCECFPPGRCCFHSPEEDML